MPSILKYEAMQELPPALLSRVPFTDVGRWFFLCSDAATEEVLEAMAVYVVAREAIRNYGPERCETVFTKLKETYEGTTWARVLTAPTLLGHVQQLRLTNINNFWDRGSFRMRFIAAALLHFAVQDPQAPLYGGALTLATMFSVITGGPGMCTWFQQQLQALGPSTSPAWCKQMLEKTDHPMVWGKTAGRPRSFAQAAENITGHDADDIQAAQIDLQAEAANHSDDDDATPSTLVVTKHCPKETWDEIYAWGCKALDYAETVAWGHCTHGGFRPFNALGVASARKAWQDAHQHGRRKWCRGNFHHATLLFPLDGLATKVLGDRIAELLELTEMMTPETFVSRFFPIPIVPRVGGAAKMVSCLHHRSMILGSDLAPVKHPVQYQLNGD